MSSYNNILQAHKNYRYRMFIFAVWHNIFLSASGYIFLVEDETKEKLDRDKTHSASTAYDTLCRGAMHRIMSVVACSLSVFRMF